MNADPCGSESTALLVRILERQQDPRLRLKNWSDSLAVRSSMLRSFLLYLKLLPDLVGQPIGKLSLTRPIIIICIGTFLYCKIYLAMAI